VVKKRLIMEQALALFAEQGIEATSIQQITDKCGISKGAFYLAFKSKEELIFNLIDHIMGEYAADVERMVSSPSAAPERLLYEYYAASLNMIRKHAQFARFLMKEPVHSYRPELISRLEMYDAILHGAVRTIALRRYPSLAPEMASDLVFTIQCFVRQYGALFLKPDIPLEIPDVCEALVEKTDVLARHASKPALRGAAAPVHLLARPSPPRREELAELLSKTAEEEPDPVLRRSLELLREHLDRPRLEPAVAAGLLASLRGSSRTKWTAYLYESYLKCRGETTN